MTQADVRTESDIVSAIAEFASGGPGGLIILPSPVTTTHRGAIIASVARFGLSAIYPFRYFAISGGLISYGPDQLDHYRRAAGYVDRILKGEKAGDLPIQGATKLEMVINPKTANALKLELPPALVARADEVIE